MVAAAVALGAVLLAGCGDPGDAVFVGVGMLDNTFSRDVTRVAVGDTVKFSNNGQTVHNAVAVDGSWTTEGLPDTEGPGLLDPGEQGRLTFDEPGVYPYFCTLHGTKEGEGMFATLVVGDVDYVANEDVAPDEPVAEWTGVTLRVPEDHPNIQNAVDAAAPGDLVLVGPAPEDAAHEATDGRYVWKEQVEVTTPYLTIRGTDRNDVIVDGEFERPNAISIFAADGVAVENLTVRNATENGVFWTSLEGYRASYVTAVNNGVYGIYAFDAVDGLFEHSYGGGSPDAGFYIGQCEDCRAVITDSIAENNALGYSGTNASGLYIINSLWRDNIVGIAPNTLDSELLPPVRSVTIAGNVIRDNNNLTAPSLDIEWPTFGNGVILAGGLDSVIERNLIVGHDRSGIFLTPNLSTNFWMTGSNTVRDNVIRDSGYADITLSGPTSGNDCFEGNDIGLTAPAGLQAFARCDAAGLPLGFDISSLMSTIGLVAEVGLGQKPDLDYRLQGPAPDQDNQPADAEVRPAYQVFAPWASADNPNVMDADMLAAVALPTIDGEDVVAMATSGSGGVITIFGAPLTLGAASAYFGIVGFLLPALLLAALMMLALLDLARRDDLAVPVAATWSVAVMAIPFVGVLAYHLVGGSHLRTRVRITAIVGGLVIWLVLLGAGVVAGGVL